MLFCPTDQHLHGEHPSHGPSSAHQAGESSISFSARKSVVLLQDCGGDPRRRGPPLPLPQMVDQGGSTGTQRSQRSFTKSLDCSLGIFMQLVDLFLYLRGIIITINVVVCYNIFWYVICITTAMKASDDYHPLLIEHRRRELAKRIQLYQ